MDITDSLFPLGIALVCIICIFFLVVSKFSYARLREEHVEDMEQLEDKDREFLLNLYKSPERFLNTTQFLIIFFILLLAGTGSYLFDTTIH